MKSKKTADVLDKKERDALAFRLGELLLALPKVSAYAGHKRPFNTLRDYVDVDAMGDPVSCKAAEYLKDISTLTTARMLCKWFRDCSDPRCDTCGPAESPTPTL